MKKILLSAALFAAAITGVKAQCTQADVPTVTEEFNSISSTFLTDETNGITVLSHNQEAAPDDGGYGDFRTDVTIGVVNMATGVNYMAKIYTKSPRVATYRAVFIDYGNTGDYELLASTVGAGTWSWQADGKMYFTIPEGKSGNATLRYVVGKDDGITTGDNYLTSCNGVAVGEVHDYAVTFPSAFPPVAVNDIVAMKQDENVVINVLANDNEGSEAVTTGTVVVEPVSGSYVMNGDDTVTYTPNAGFRGVDAFTYTITSSVGVSEEASVKVVVYGYKDIDGKQTLIIEDFDTKDETVGGVVPDDDGYAWDGSFAWAVPAPGGSKADETSDVKAGAGAMLISINASPDAGIVMDDTHTGNKVDLSNVATKLQFSAADDNNVMGMWVMPYEVYAGMKFGFMLKRVDAFDADADGTPGNSYADKYTSAYVDGADMTEWEFNFVGVDLASLEAEYKGAYVLHKLRYASDANTGTTDIVIDEIGLYPASNLSAKNIELEGVTVYPNPVQNVLNIKAGNNATVTVLNTIGSKVYEGEAKSISTQSWKKGLYFVVVKEGNASKTVKVIK